jgi:methylated-DNA-[protein]-cysteine S-methyltransferase
MDDTGRRYTIFDTAAGFCGVAWSTRGVTRLQLPTPSADAAERLLRRREPDAAPESPPPPVAAAVALVRRYFAGEAAEFGDVALDLAGQSSFFLQVYAATRAVGWGATTTYGALASGLGAGPAAARDVGRAMASNPVPLIIPCHRVLAAGGKPGGFSAPGGAAAKLRMLALEGARLDPAPDQPPPAAQSSFAF